MPRNIRTLRVKSNMLPTTEIRTDPGQRVGLIHLCCGSGVGKTSRAVCLAIKESGTGLDVTFVQFMKSGNPGEIEVLEKNTNIHYRCPGKHRYSRTLENSHHCSGTRYGCGDGYISQDGEF